MPDKPKSLIAGSTGLVGSLLLKDLGSGGEQIVLISRKANQFMPRNTSEIVINFDDLLSGNFGINEEIDHVYWFCKGLEARAITIGFAIKKDADSLAQIDLLRISL